MVCDVTTAPGHPESPTGLEVVTTGPHSVQLKWKVQYLEYLSIFGNCMKCKCVLN